LPGEGGRSAKSLAIILIVHLVVILLWQVTVDAFHVPKFILPSPLAALVTLAHPNYAWVSNLLVTAIEILGGFLLGAAVGVALAVIFTWSRLVALLLLPLFVTLNMIPKVAMGPLVIVKSLRGSRWTLFRKIQLPGSLPYVFSGMKVGAILAVAGAIVGEFIASDRGLGYLMIQVQSSLDTPAMVMAVVLLTLLGVGLYGMVLGLERLFVVRDVRLQQ